MTEMKYFVPSVDHAARILEFLSRYKSKQSTLTEISNALNINKSSCLRILKTLEYRNLVYYNSFSRNYSLGIFTAVLGARVHETLDYLVYIEPFLAELAGRTELTAVLIQRISAKRLMFVASEEPIKYSHIKISIGQKFPITEVGYGKWYFAYLPEPFRKEQFIKCSESDDKIINANRFLTDLDELKQTGALVKRRNGLCAISSPVFAKNETVLGVMATIGMASEIDEMREKEICTQLVEISKRCSEKFINLSVADVIK